MQYCQFVLTYFMSASCPTRPLAVRVLADGFLAGPYRGPRQAAAP
jgi:hypothetical protein